MNFTKINKLNLKSTIDREDIVRANKSILNNRNERYHSTSHNTRDERYYYHEDCLLKPLRDEKYHSTSHNTRDERYYYHEDCLLKPLSHNTRDEVFLIEEYEATLHGYNIKRKDIESAFRNASLEFETTKK